jgi:hypothetical protein
LRTLPTPRGEISVPDRLIVRIANRVWRLSPAQRAHHVERARQRIETGRFGRNDAATVLAADRG